jgi:uncharacterized cupin superfamily protein
MVEGEFRPSPIRPAWILDGNPVARIYSLFSSADGTAITVIWDCSPGRFNWFYSVDETVYVLEGSVTLKDRSGNSRRVVAGDTVFFPAGSRAEWTVDSYIKKIAFLRSPLPPPLATARRVVKRLLAVVRGGGKAQATPMLGG